MNKLLEQINPETIECLAVNNQQILLSIITALGNGAQFSDVETLLELALEQADDISGRLSLYNKRDYITDGLQFSFYPKLGSIDLERH